MHNDRVRANHGSFSNHNVTEDLGAWRNVNVILDARHTLAPVPPSNSDAMPYKNMTSHPRSRMDDHGHSPIPDREPLSRLHRIRDVAMQEENREAFNDARQQRNVVAMEPARQAVVSDWIQHREYRSFMATGLLH